MQRSHGLQPVRPDWQSDLWCHGLRPPIGAAWGAGWVANGLLVVALIVIDLLIYPPFFKVYEKQLLAQEAENEADMQAQDCVINK